ncbi:MAG: trypsin-like peptidase domain-containing protein [Acidobacteriia bacterium]|nr:trypsin-like peptidase domain-containing protein [Terriglobia bacterium]
MDYGAPLQYTRLTGDTAKYPYVVGVTTPRYLGSGILLDSLHVLTCNHTRSHDDPLLQYTQITVITASGPLEAQVEFLDEESDLALLRLDREFHASAPGFEEGLLRRGEPLIAVGVQPLPGLPGTLTVAEVGLEHKNSNQAGGAAFDIQLDGGPRPGYSGGPVLRQKAGALVCVGMTKEGGKLAPVGTAIGTASLRAFVNQHLPESNWLGSAEDGRAATIKNLLSYSERSRDGLTPYVLARIPRVVVHEKYLPAIRRGIVGEKKRIVPIIAPAGFGKSILLSEIYDELIREGRWVLLLLCSDLAISPDLPDRLSERMGRAVSEDTQPIESVVQRLTAVQGSGVLLIDTLDLILSGPLVAALRRLLMLLTDLGATVVFTCRDYEYEAFLEPVNARLAGLSAIVDRYKVPLFSSAEVMEAAQNFIAGKTKGASLAGAVSFGQAILDLSADNRPLRELTSNPLLLALTCELFGETGEVPHDLTVSRLYATYWGKKINRSWNQKYDPNSPVALRKEEISLHLAGTLAGQSDAWLVDSLFAADLQLPPDEITVAARSDLFSEDVLRSSPGGRISFFHQTFLEYAIARWLALVMGSSLRDRIIAELAQPSSAPPLYWWPVIRQLLTLVSNREFVEYSERLNLNHLVAFRAAAFAATSRDDEVALRYLGSIAAHLPAEHHQTLLQAIDGIQSPLLDEAFHIATMLLLQGEAKIATNAAHAAGALLTRYQAGQAPRLMEALSVI